MPPSAASSNIQSPVVRFYATAEQIEALTCTRRFLSLFAGRRWGKTDFFFMRAGLKCLNNLGFKYTYTAPSYSLAKEQYERMCSEFGPFIKRATGQPKPTITFHTGSRIQFRSTDRAKLIRGTGENEVFVDESQDIKQQDFEKVLRPLVSDRRGTIILAGQFRGKTDWRYEKYYEPGQNPDRYPEYRSWRFSSENGIAFQGEKGQAELQALREQLPRAVYEQEIQCLPISNQAAVFRPEDIEAATTGYQDPPQRMEPGWQYLAGVDLGWRVDYTAVVVIGINPTSGELKVVEAWQQPLNTKHEMNAPQIAKRLERWNARAVVDITGGAAGGKKPADENLKFYRQFLPDMQGFTWNQDNKERLIKHMSLKIENFRIKIPGSFKELIRELHAYEFKYANGFYKWSAPEGQHDDMVTAMALAIWGLHCSWQRGSLSGGQLVTGII